MINLSKPTPETIHDRLKRLKIKSVTFSFVALHDSVETFKDEEFQWPSVVCLNIGDKKYSRGSLIRINEQPSVKMILDDFEKNYSQWRKRDANTKPN